MDNKQLKYNVYFLWRINFFYQEEGIKKIFSGFEYNNLLGTFTG